MSKEKTLGPISLVIDLPASWVAAYPSGRSSSFILHHNYNDDSLTASEEEP